MLLKLWSYHSDRLFELIFRLFSVLFYTMAQTREALSMPNQPIAPTPPNNQWPINHNSLLLRFSEFSLLTQRLSHQAPYVFNRIHIRCFGRKLQFFDKRVGRKTIPWQLLPCGWMNYPEGMWIYSEIGHRRESAMNFPIHECITLV